jgi:hypothetical protein
MCIKFDGFKVFCRSLSGQTLHTLSQGQPFTFQMYEGHEVKIYFTPMRTRTPRSVRQRYIEEYIGQFNINGGSLRPVDYWRLINASYIVTLFKLYLNHLN